MTWQPELDELKKRQILAQQMGAPDKVARHKADSPTESVIVCIASLPEGQALFLRGEGPGLFKTSGVPMANPVKGVWEWRVEASGPVTFRVHLNDETPSELSELTVHPGEMLEIADPRF